MDAHVRTLAILNIVLGGFGILIALVILLVFGGIAGLVGMAGGGESERLVAIPIVALVAAVLFLVMMIISLPCIVAGFGLLRYRQWARTLAIVVSSVNLMNVPLGTALGLYGLWVLLSPETEPLFEVHPQRMSRA